MPGDNPRLLMALPCGKTEYSIARLIGRGKSHLEFHADALRIHITTVTKLLVFFEDAAVISRTKEGIPIHDVNRLDSMGME